ncbi:MAG TPA: response regulator [Thermoanaerobaculia bacterium]|jgi:CheY-like chemotaxis protein|nr:response regulator [Thermoanaerobaculia bacterium]
MQEPTARRILIADDQEVIRTLVARVLRRAGFQPFEATDGEDAITQLEAERFDAVVLDLMMPRVDGFGVIEHLIRSQPQMVEKTIVMTAFPQTAAKGRLNHVCAVLAKPFEVTELIRHVQECASR